MNETERIRQWVEYKIGKLIADDIEKQIQSEESHFDVNKYCQSIFQTHFSTESLVSEDCLRLNFDSDDFCLTDTSNQDSLSDDGQFDFQQPSLDKIISDLQSPHEETQAKALEAMAASSPEDFIAHSSWTVARKILQDMIKTSSDTFSVQLLEVFRRFLFSTDMPKAVCEGFVTLVESVPFQLEALTYKETDADNYDFKKNKWLKGNSGEQKGSLEMIWKSLWLLVQSQKGIPLKWSRFNEKRLKEMILCFINMLVSCRRSKGSELCVLEILSVLDPKATWCSNWCHGATGRSLLYSALKIHIKLFSEIVDFVLVWVKNSESAQKTNSKMKLPPLRDKRDVRSKSEMNTFTNLKKEKKFLKGNRSAPPFATDANLHKSNCVQPMKRSWMMQGMPGEITNEAKFCHCLSMAVYIIQYQGGRALFPLEVPSRRRRITVSEFNSCVVNHINRIVFFSERNPLTTDEYQEHMLKLVEIVKSSVKKE